MNQANEVFDVVDKTDRIVGQAERRYVHEHNLLHRAVHVFIQIRNGGWLLQKRSAKKDIDPLLWTTSCSGHVDSGEDYEDSAIRECKEELGLELRVADLEEVFRCSPCLETGHEFVRVYLLRCSDEFLPNDQEIMEVAEKGLEEIESGLSCFPQSYASSFRYLFPFMRMRCLK